MDLAYEGYFNERLDQLLNPPGRLGPDVLRRGSRDEDPAHFVARGAADQARLLADQAGLRLRPDAALLLYLLSYEFAAAPVRAVRPELTQDLPGAVAEDITQIVQRAIERMQEVPDGISAHSIVDGLSASWDDLQTTALNVWG